MIGNAVDVAYIKFQGAVEKAFRERLNRRANLVESILIVLKKRNVCVSFPLTKGLKSIFFLDVALALVMGFYPGNLLRLIFSLLLLILVVARTSSNCFCLFINIDVLEHLREVSIFGVRLSREDKSLGVRLYTVIFSCSLIKKTGDILIIDCP